MHRRRVSSIIIRRRWILVGLLPYLLLLLTNGGFHHHPGVTSPGGAESLADSSKYPIFSPAHTDCDGECPGCQWLAAAGNCIFASPFIMTAIFTAEIAVSPRLHPSAFSPLFLSIRAPPSA